jgi:carbamoylphosphate synthase large subunit
MDFRRQAEEGNDQNGASEGQGICGEADCGSQEVDPQVRGEEVKDRGSRPLSVTPADSRAFMRKTILVTGAGTGATSNLIRSLRTGCAGVHIIGCHHDRFVLKKSAADVNYLVPAVMNPDFPDAIRQIVSIEDVGFVIPNNDAEVKIMAGMRDSIGPRLFLPSESTIDLCQDKYALSTHLRARQVPAPDTRPISTLDDVEAVFSYFEGHQRLWCRTRFGSRSRGATVVANPAQARAWISYWETMRSVPSDVFTFSEYLPGRDFLAQGIWKGGRLILLKTFERLRYLGGENSPSGVSSLSALAKTVVDPRLLEISTRTVQAIDAQASGVFSIDFKENQDGVPCVTEINPGRLFMAMTAFDTIGAFNMTATYVRLGLGETVEVAEPYDVADSDYYLVRELDTVPQLFHSEEFFQGIRELS